MLFDCDDALTPLASLVVASVNGETAGSSHRGHAGSVMQICLQHLGRGAYQFDTGRLRQRAHCGMRMHFTRPQHLASVNIADTAHDVLIKHHLGDRLRGIRVRHHPTHAFVDVVVGRTKVGPETAKIRVPHEAVGSVCLDHRRTEAHRNPFNGFDDDPSQSFRLSPLFTTSVEMPTTRHAHVRVQHDLVVPRDFEVFAVCIDRLDGASHSWRGTGESRGYEANHLAPDKRRAQRCCCTMDGIPLWHIEMLDAPTDAVVA